MRLTPQSWGRPWVSRLAVLPAPGLVGRRESRPELCPVFRGSRVTSQSAFSLLEVMIACGIFFMAVFAILQLVSSTVKNARSLRRIEVDAGMVAAQLSKTNQMTEGIDSGDFGDMYQDYSWETATYGVASNGLVQVDIVVRRRGVPNPTDVMSILVYDPKFKSTEVPRGLQP